LNAVFLVKSVKYRIENLKIFITRAFMESKRPPSVEHRVENVIDVKDFWSKYGSEAHPHALFRYLSLEKITLGADFLGLGGLPVNFWNDKNKICTNNDEVTKGWSIEYFP
jgi:hypothetical protein